MYSRTTKGRPERSFSGKNPRFGSLDAYIFADIRPSAERQYVAPNQDEVHG